MLKSISITKAKKETFLNSLFYFFILRPKLLRSNDFLLLIDTNRV